MQRFALAARLRADDPQHLFPVVLATEDASGVRPSGALDPEGPGRGGGINRHPLRAVALVEEAPVWFLALAMEPRRPAADGYLVTAREAAMGADCPFLPRTPILIRNIRHLVVIKRFFVFSIRNIVAACCG